MTDYKGTVSYTYRTFIQRMTELHTMLDSLGIHQGAHVAIAGRSCSNWGVTFATLMASRRVAVSLLPEFAPEDILRLIEHSDSTCVFFGDWVWRAIMQCGYTPETILQRLPNVRVILSLADFSILAQQFNVAAATVQPLNVASATLNDAPASLNVAPATLNVASATLNGAPAPLNVAPATLNTSWWQWGADDELALINYTSGTTSQPKGVMLSYASISSNVEQARWFVPNPEGLVSISILPMAHMFGLIFDFAKIVSGVHVHYVTKPPTPTILAEALAEIHPFVLICVPLVLEKVFRARVLPMVKKPVMRVALAIPVVGTLLRRKIVGKIMSAMGGNLRMFVIGGASLNQEVEQWMCRLGVPYINGYGMTECGPMIAGSPAGTFPAYSCGKAMERVSVRVDSPDTEHVEGELLTRGVNVMLGYYKNEAATHDIIDADGWLHTGDLVTMDHEGNIFIRGRKKNLILSGTGQNIYPEELEDKLSDIEGVAESLVVSREDKLVALIYIDPLFCRQHKSRHITEAQAMSAARAQVSEAIQSLNRTLPAYARIARVEYMENEFEKTPKRSIKRYLYQ